MFTTLDGSRAETAGRALQQMLSRVEAASPENDPFPHFAIRNFFPAAIYRRMLELLPADEQYSLCDQEKNRGYDGSVNRSRFQLTDAHIAGLSGESQEFWLGVRDALGSPELKRAVFRKLAPGLAFRFGVPASQAADVAGYPRPELFREKQGYRIAPHPDTRSKIVTMQLSLAADDSQADLGTGFYRRSFSPAAWLREPRGFEVAKRMPFLPNAAYAFVVLNNLTKRSWHGRETLGDEAGVRNSILHIYYANRRHANADIVREQYPTTGDERAAA